MIEIRLPFLLLTLCCLITGCDFPTAQDKLGWVPEDYFEDARVAALCRAIEENDVPAMQASIKEGADINSVGRKGMTPLLWSYPGHRIKRFRWLLEHGADPNVCLTGDLGSPYYKGTSVTYLAIKSMHTDYYPLVLKHGGDPNLRCNGQREPIMFLPTRGHTPDQYDRITALIEAGADIDAKGSTGATLAMSAAATGRYQLTLFLLENGADVSAYQEQFNRQLVHFIVPREGNLNRYSESNRESYRKVVKFLKDAGVDFSQARSDLKRWESWIGIKAKKEGRDREYVERKAREAKEEKQPEPAAHVAE